MTDLPAPPFAGETDATIRDRMLTAVSDDFVKLEGDVIYDMLQPAALELERAYMALETQVWQVYPQTATEGNLDNLAAEQGLTRDTDESDTVFRARVLDALTAPVGAGTVADYQRAVANVAGAGPVSVVSEAPGELTFYATASDHSVPGTPVLDAVDAAIAAILPVTVASYTVEPATTELDGPFVLTLTPPSPGSGQVAAWVEKLEGWFASLVPGQEVDYYQALVYAGIPSTRLAGVDLDGDTNTIWAPADASGTVRATSITVEF